MKRFGIGGQIGRSRAKMTWNRVNDASSAVVSTDKDEQEKISDNIWTREKGFIHATKPDILGSDVSKYMFST